MTRPPRRLRARGAVKQCTQPPVSMEGWSSSLALPAHPKRRVGNAGGVEAERAMIWGA